MSFVILPGADAIRSILRPAERRSAPRHRVDQVADAHDRLDDVTRPRPSIGPAMAGAVDLSGLKQRAQQRVAGRWHRRRRDAGRRRWPRSHRDHRGQFRRRSAAPVRRSARRGAVVVTAQRRVRPAGRHPVRPGRRRQRQVVAGDGQRRRGTQGGPDLRCRGGPDRGGFGRRAAAVQLSGHAAARPVAALGGFAAVGDGRESSGAQRDSEDSDEVDPELAQAREQLEAGDFAAAKEAYQAILDADPGSVEAKGAIRQIDFLMRATAHRPDAVGASPTRHPATSKPRSRPPTCKSSTRT